MVIAALVLAGVAALIHVYIFFLESIAWTGERARATFGFTADEAATMKLLAFNQGFYNLFLAIVTTLGIIFFAAGAVPIGATLLFVGTGSMTAAALVLLISAPAKRAAALKQGVVPLLAVVALVIGLSI
jgi:putative membrane protein